jgi:hypothetical protein
MVAQPLAKVLEPAPAPPGELSALVAILSR